MLKSYVNKRNCRIYSEKKNQQTIIEAPLYPQNVTVWCSILAGGIIGLYTLKIMPARMLEAMETGIDT